LPLKLMFDLFVSYYHQKDKFSQLLEVVSNEIVHRSKQIVTKDISSQSQHVCCQTLNNYCFN